MPRKTALRNLPKSIIRAIADPSEGAILTNETDLCETQLVRAWLSIWMSSFVPKRKDTLVGFKKPCDSSKKTMKGTANED